MKTEKATIKLVLRTNKTLADGTHPIMLRVNWRGQRAEKSSGFSCKEANWSATSECLKVKGRDAISNAETINIIIQEEKHKAENILNTFIMEKKSYTAQMIVDYLKDEGRGVKYTKDLNNLVTEYINVHRVKEETIQSINGIVKHFKAYMGKENIYLADVSKANAVGFGRWCAEKGFKNNTIRTHIQKMRALYRYAVNTIGVAKDNPFVGIEESKIYAAENNKQALTKDALTLLRYFYLSKLDSWGNGKADKKFFVVGHKIFACNVFFLCYEFQGLALIDMAKLRSSNFDTTRMTDKANHYVEVHTKRSKTRRDVPIAVRMDNFNALLITPYIKYMADNVFFLPILKESDDTDKKILVKMRYATSAINKNLKDVWKEYNTWLMDLVEKYSEKPLPKKIYEGWFEHRLVANRNINKETMANFYINEKTTLYSARHTFATIFINSEGAKTAELAQMMGRNVSGIDRYIKELMSIEDVLNARDKMK